MRPIADLLGCAAMTSSSSLACRSASRSKWLTASGGSVGAVTESRGRMLYELLSVSDVSVKIDHSKSCREKLS